MEKIDYKELIEYYEAYYNDVIRLRDLYYDRLAESPANKKHYDAIVREARKQLYWIKEQYEFHLKLRAYTSK